MDAELARIEDLGGEGLMLREPRSYYENRRSYTLLKVKTFKDAEAVVIKHEKGTGKNSAVLGALHVRDEDGITFKIGSGFTDAQRRNPPRIGSTVTYKY
jgi:DNA ligase-1